METTFNMIIVGMTACGRRHYLLSMLERDYMEHFESILLLCPTFEWNKAYHEWKYMNDPDFLAIPRDQDDNGPVLKHVVNPFKGSNSLIILDDRASGQEIKNRTSEVAKLEFSARHYELSTIVITQKFTSVAKPYRENISKLVVFYTANRNDMRTIVDDDHNGASKRKPMEDLLRDLGDAEEKVKAAAKEATDAAGIQAKAPELDHKRTELLRLSGDGEISHSVSYLKKASR